MSETSGTVNTIIVKAFENWAQKTWFQIIAIIILVYLLLAPVAGPIIYNYINSTNTSEAVVQSLDQRDKAAREQHRLNYEKSKQKYAEAKTVMREYLESTSSDYIFLFEFHNGIENVMSGVQFCRFDLTLEVLKDNLTYVNHEKFRDDIVARYDIMLSEEFETAASRAMYFKVDDLKYVDRYLEQQIRYLDAKSCAVINVTDKSGVICGTLLFVSLDDSINLTEVYKCQRDIEKVFRN